ncbi:MAG TPA: NADH-quinone oxidoreductase subunit J [Coriobacteriia bacterium]
MSDPAALTGAVLVTSVAWWAVALVTLTGAIAVLVARETMRLIAGLGTFLIGVAGLYVYQAMPLLGASQVFLYVGGVLVLFLFAIMALRRSDDGRSQLTRRLDLSALAVSAGLFSIMAAALRGLSGQLSASPLAAAGTAATAEVLLGRYLPHFELVGGLLLVALVAAVAISAGGEER